MQRNRATAFTLIELLVVIGIIALLIGILLPVLSKSKQAAVKVHCSAQVRQIALALEAYGNDAKERYPFAGRSIDWGQIDALPDGSGMSSWMEQLFYHLPSKDVMSGCHSYPRDTPYHYFLSTRAAYVTATSANGFAAVDRRRVRYTSAFVLAGDNNWKFSEDPTPDADKDDYTQSTLALTAGTNHWEPQHNNGLNVAFADGHVASFQELDGTAMTWRYDVMSLW